MVPENLSLEPDESKAREIEELRRQMDEFVAMPIPDIAAIPAIRQRRVELVTAAGNLGLNFMLELTKAKERRKQPQSENQSTEAA